jgi:NAD-dependent deacetylase
MLIAGTSAVVVPAAWFPNVVAENGGKLVEVNIDETPYSATAVASIRAPAGEALPKLLEAVRERRTGRQDK